MTVKDPLTDSERQQWLLAVQADFNRRYKQALSCGALSEEDLKHSIYGLARCVLQITAKDFEPLSKEDKKLLKNLELMT